MVKKILVLGIAVISIGIANAKDYGAAGCGVGAIIFDGQSGLGPHVMAATTNGFYGTQTFAMTSGTLGCEVDGTITSHAALNLIDGNMERVAQAIATGQGEALVALADSLKVAESDRIAFNKTLKSNFNAIYTDQSVSSLQVYYSIIDVLENDSVLSQYATS